MHFDFQLSLKSKLRTNFSVKLSFRRSLQVSAVTDEPVWHTASRQTGV